MSKNIFTIFIILFSILLIRPHNVLAESMHNMNMEEDKQKQNDEMDMEGHDERKKLNSSKGINEIIFPEILKSEKDKNGYENYTLNAQEGKTEFYKDNFSETLGYNGNLLGPTLKLKKGEKVKIKLVNNLDENTTFHWHGLEIDGKVDGGPSQVIKPGEEKIIKFEVKQEAATLWYHPHPSPNTAKQVYNGLSGLLYIEDGKNHNYPNEYGKNDLPIIIQDKTFISKKLDYSETKDIDGTQGDTVIVNGKVNPKLTTKKGKVRLRLLNGSNARDLNLKLSNNKSFEYIASDGGFLDKPQQLKEINLAPSERKEIIVDLSKLKNGKVNLVDNDNTVILPINNKEKSDNKEITTKIDKRIKLEGMDDKVTINGKKFDPNRIDLTQKKDKKEIWEIENVKDKMGGMKHPFHIHGTQFKVVSVDGKAPPKDMKGKKDVISLEPGQKAKIEVVFKNTGIFMFHCHILEHEDSGMMGQVKVTK
ncbi:multicopper oxidase domain-containing protein [Staphylococcus haemolyticus]|uniref:multicopper oxidase family protein n=1 Tax=Staphylococcus haemolyticus TaxID=1283 RepID=UPI00187990FB|nr:multicopper oxidase domain-containing protein [Staphylococcus haemolyticus]MBE7355566.1 multicopper oxidase domain-containing protein [Staphylococcus haemolyticus]